METGCIIMAAGKGSRMKGFNGNKTLLPLDPQDSCFTGTRPILLHIIDNLPSGPKTIVIHHKKKEVIEHTRPLNVSYCEQTELNGTGGALLAARPFLEAHRCQRWILTMGDVPLVNGTTYEALLEALDRNDFVVLGFVPADKKQYGVLEIQNDRIRRIIEWKYWKTFPEKHQKAFPICNSGIYGAKRDKLLHYLAALASRPHVVKKEINGRWIEIQEFFATDLVEFMSGDGLSVGYVLAQDEWEVMGVDDVSSLKTAQQIFRERYLHK